VVQQVCICPHFAYWQNSDRGHFLVNKVGAMAT